MTAHPPQDVSAPGARKAAGSLVGDPEQGSWSSPAEPDREAWRPMPAARLPTRSGAIGVLGPVLATLLLAAGIVLVIEALVASGLLAGTGLVATGLATLNGLPPGPWFLVGGIVAALMGVWLIVVALSRRVRSRVTVTSRTGIYLGVGDVARLASAAAEEVGGVISASTVATRRRVTTTIRSTGDAGIADAVRRSVADRLTMLDPAPRVAVAVRGKGRTTDGGTP
ncbi:DUF6286 domain-containing protein [Georgenia yuyongxinii]|uniref:DUF6286 domain-containing protein n=1 Tax=Georgenia yuyongxinii TaxID=2589797 RepID=A0A552WMW9_9MICO|nr:DUF6286 domain-containing protein [Georgenia yuyongxinii]TRW44106.1 hypothetical protein FJ693_14870 [Georgenia yuyongxinii]